MRSIKTIIAALFAVMLLVAGCSANSESTQTSQPASGGKGNITFVVSDAAADMGAVSEVAVTIDSVEVHAAGGNENWTTVSMASSSDPVFELLQLRDSGASQLLAQVELEAGTYDQVRLNISTVMVTVTGADGDLGVATHEAKLPSNRLTLHGLLTVEAGGNATADFDFQTDESLHITGEGTYILAPVVKVETRSNASVNVHSSGRVEISGGRVDRLSADSDSGVIMSQGMNSRGESGIGHRVTPDARLALSIEGKLLQVGGRALATGKIKAVTPDKAAVTIETESGTDLTLHVASDSDITVDGSPAKVSDLSSRRGAMALVAYNAETGALISLSVGGTGKARAQSEARSARAMVELVRGRPDTSVSADLASEAAESGTTVAIGAITAVNPAEGTITVRNSSGESVTLKAHSDSRLMVSGNLATVAQLRDMVGSEATVEYLAESRTVLGLNVRDKKGLNAANVKVLIMAVNPAAGTVVLQTPSGQEITLNVTAQSSIMADGAISSLEELRGMVGSEAEVEYLPESKEVLALQGHSIPLHLRAGNGAQVRDGGTGIVTRPRSGEIQADAVMTGTLKAVNVTEGTVTVITQSGQEVALKIAPGTTVLVGSSPATVAALAASVGSHVTVTSYEGATTAVEISVGGDAPISARATARGTVKFFNERAGSKGQGQFTLIRPTSGGQVSEIILQVNSDTLVLVNGARVGIANLPLTAGVQVTAEYNSQTNTAIVIAVETPASATGPATERPILPRSP